MKKKKSPMDLGRRERQIMAYIYRLGQATAAEVMEGIANPPSYSGVRAMLPHVDEFRPVHNLESLAELAQALAEDAPLKVAA